MSFPYTTIANFEDGTMGHFDAEVDTANRLDFPHYTELSRMPGVAMPYRGAYCMRIDLGASTTNAYVQETGSWDLTAGTDHVYIRFKLWISPDLVMADTNEFGVLQFWSATSTLEGGLFLNYTTANGLRIGIGAAGPAFAVPINLNEWMDIEVLFDPAAGSGTIDAWVNGTALPQAGSLTMANITSVVLGVVGQDAGTTTGIMLFDEVIGHVNGSRIGSGGQRFPLEVLLESSGHVFVGSGVIHNASLYAGAGTDNILQVWDTDRADTTNGTMKLELRNLSNNETPVDPAGVPIEITKGAYISLAGTNPRGLVSIYRSATYGSDGAMRTHAY